MKNKSIKFTKTYTRDNCFLIQESWYNRYTQGVDSKINPHIPIQVFYINNGMVEIWENKKAVNWFQDQLLEKNLRDKNFFVKSVKKYQDILDKLTVYWQKKYLESISELRSFIKLMDLGTKYFLIYYYSCVDKRNPQSIKNKAFSIRAVDSYYDNSDRIIRNTLHHIFPRISYDLGLSIVYSELSKLPSTNILKERYKQCVFIPGQYFQSEPLKKYLQSHPEFRFVFDEYKENQKVITGSVAFKGKAKGKVKIIKNKSSIVKFKSGEILVSPMTTPLFLTAMKNSIAIITDEGGITCHAAIVSRELKKPCIIATKIATQVLKDGDLVEVDANKGVVKILKRA